MPSATDIRTTLKEKLKAFETQKFKDSSIQLLQTLGYHSDRTLNIANSSTKAFLELITGLNTGVSFDQEKALFADWKSADLLFQLTDDELSQHISLFKETDIKPGLLRSYLFFAIELKGDNYARGKLTAIARQLNRIFPMPVMVIIKHSADKVPVLSIAVINRRLNKRDASKDVLGKVTIIRDISVCEPHRGHLDILASLALSELKHPEKKTINNFDTLHEAWEEIFNVELLNKRFYRELSNWYFWAMHHCHFPLLDEKADRYFLFKDREKVREHEAKNLIRLLTRILFVWFIKQKNLVPDAFFDSHNLSEKFLEGFDPNSKESRYYKAILQNLFFAVLNQVHGKREFRKQGQHHNTTNLLRYEAEFKDPKAFIQAVEEITPFLNGGLFDCLDYPHPTKVGPLGGKVTIYEDGFSDRKDNPLVVPDFLFFGEERTEDLSADFGDPKKKKETVRGLIRILERYKFTIVENTPIEQEVALDPELLGQVFENLLASYNEETKTTARKQTGSFYTPRTIVDYMVDESLKAHLSRCFAENADIKETDARAGLDLLFAYTEKEHAFTSQEVEILIRAIDNCKILDPACGSGAFPMGALQKLVYILGKLDPRDELWERRQIAKVNKLIESAQDIDDTAFRERAIEDLEAQKKDIEEAFAKNELGYGRKLYLIENCLYGVDIQSIATQVSKLRFFISLIVEQTVDRKRGNFGVRPLPNLETKFVTADTLIQIEKPTRQGELFELAEVSKLQKELKQVRHELFSAKTPRTKNAKRDRDKELREAIASELKQNGWDSISATKLAQWDPYDQNSSAPYFDPEWMFGIRGFDIVIGNPPYIQIQNFPKEQKDKWLAQNYQTYAATADIYCLFYERGAQLLNEGGLLVYITMNRWMRAGYGDKIREYFSQKVNIIKVLDFGMAQNFGAATTLTCIVQFSKAPSQKTALCCYATDDKAAMRDPQGYFEEHAVTQSNLSELPWVILSSERYRIKKQVEAQGIPLEKWNIQINYGIKTGFNDAFYITQEQRDAFIEQDPKCKDYLVPLLRGRFVEKYGHSWDGTWMIATFPILDLRLDQLPNPIRKHLETYRTQLEPKPKNWKGTKWDGRKAGAYEWFETQDSIAYHKDFAKPKILYPNMTKFLPFYYDTENGFFTNDKGFIITSENESLAYLTAFLNSSLFKCCFRDNFPELMGNTYEVRKIFVDILPVKKPTEAEAKLFEKLVPLVQFAKKHDLAAPAGFLEDLIDACVLECYFRDHMRERDILFHTDLAPHLDNYDLNTTPTNQQEFIEHLYNILNAPKHPIRNRLLRLSIESPDFLAIIKNEGQV